MFDLRYHVASLAAVFLALIIGILVGVGIADRGLVDKAEVSILNARVDQLKGQLARAEADSRLGRSAQNVVDKAYPALMHGRLQGRRIALVFVGSVDGEVRSSVEQALVDADAVGVVRMRALKVPIDPKALAAVLVRRPLLSPYADDRQIAALGRALGQELVGGGQTPLWEALSGKLVEEGTGSGRRPVDGVVIARSVPPQARVTAQFLRGFYAGLGSTLAPAVGVEATTVATSAVDAYRRAGLSSVDDVDTPSGRLALVLLLAGGRAGHYGVKAGSRDGVVPPIEPLQAPPASGG